jgi:heat shock protein HslJ
MKVLFFIPIFTMLLGCKAGPTFNDVIDKDWKLIKVQIDGNDILFDRAVLRDDGFGELFTIKFNEGMVSGKGAINNYRAPYKQEKNYVLAIQPAAATLMAPLHEPEKLKEYDFFNYITNTYRWIIEDNNLKLYSKTNDEKEAILIFIQY